MSFMPRPFRQDHPIGKILAANGWLASEFAHEVGMSERCLSNYLAGRPIPDHYLMKMAEVLDIDPHDLYPEEALA